MARSSRMKVAAIAALAAVCATTLAGCDEFQEFDQYRARRDSITPYVGDSVRHNIAVQTIDPWPPHARNNKIGLEGNRAVLAAERYRANKVLSPQGLSGGGGGGGRGAGAAPAAAAK